MPIQETTSKFSGEDVIELIRESRNDVIKRLMDLVALRRFLLDRFEMEGISLIKLEFIRRTLKELANSPVDLSHYSTLILDVRKAGSLAVSKKTDTFFLQDVERAIESYTLR